MDELIISDIALFFVSFLFCTIHSVYDFREFIEARDFLRAIESKTNIWPTFQEGMEVNQIIEAARDSSFKRAWVHVCDY